jgi:hypothetical protein
MALMASSAAASVPPRELVQQGQRGRPVRRGGGGADAFDVGLPGARLSADGLLQHLPVVLQVLNESCLHGDAGLDDGAEDGPDPAGVLSLQYPAAAEGGVGGGRSRGRVRGRAARDGQQRRPHRCEHGPRARSRSASAPAEGRVRNRRLSWAPAEEATGRPPWPAPRHRTDTDRFRAVTPGRVSPAAGERPAATDLCFESGTTSVAGGSPPPPRRPLRLAGGATSLGRACR